MVRGLDVRDIDDPSFGRTVDERGVQVDSRRSGGGHGRFVLGPKPLANGLDDCEVGRRRDRYEAFTDRADQLSAPADKARERHALEKGTLLDFVFDDLGDAVVEAVEEQLEPGEDAWLDDRVVGEGFQSRNGVRTFGHGESALSEKPADLA
jgi:hypothetical protein